MATIDQSKVRQSDDDVTLEDEPAVKRPKLVSKAVANSRAISASDDTDHVLPMIKGELDALQRPLITKLKDLFNDRGLIDTGSIEEIMSYLMKPSLGKRKRAKRQAGTEPKRANPSTVTKGMLRYELMRLKK